MGLLEMRPMRMSLEDIFLQLTTDETEPATPVTPAAPTAPTAAEGDAHA